LYGLNSVDFSSDGQYIATGGEDSKVKLWNTSTGFCFVTFSEHIAPVTGVKFAGKGSGKVILSSSLDGTIRAHDLLRYKSFRTLTTPSLMQFTSLSIDSSGEIVTAGSMDPFNVFVWSLQKGPITGYPCGSRRTSRLLRLLFRKLLPRFRLLGRDTGDLGRIQEHLCGDF
jgi:periodic tryptophan protein 2